MTSEGHLRSSEMSRFDRKHVISYCRSIVTMALSIPTYMNCIGNWSVSHLYSTTPQGMIPSEFRTYVQW